MKVKRSGGGNKSKKLRGLDDSSLHCENGENEVLENTCACQLVLTREIRSVNNQCQRVIV
jgi:hypothetical protein